MAPQIMVAVNKRLPGITVYDADSLRPLAQALTSVAPHEVVLSADGHCAYVPIYGSSGVGKPGTDEHTFHIFRTSDCSEVARLDTGEFKRLHSLVAGRSGMIYVSAECAASVVLIDPKTASISGHIPTGSATSHFIAVDRNETTIYCSNVQSKTVSVLDIASRSLVATVETGVENQRMTISPDGRWFVTNLGPARAVGFFRTSDYQLDFQVGCEGRPFVSKFSADGSTLYNAGMLSEGTIVVSKVDVAGRTISRQAVLEGQDLGSLEVNPFNGRVYVSDQPTNRITILDGDTLEQVGAFTTAPAPDAIAFGRVL